MVETLGMLAIMGVLALGEIIAYRYAVTKYQADEAGESCDADDNCCPPDKPLFDSQGQCSHL